jgi:hypothetical protein
MPRADSPVEPIPTSSGLSGPSLLAKVSQADIVLEPFPHVVVRNALDPELADRLRTEIPPVATLGQGQAMGSNVRVSYPCRMWLDDPSVSSTWKHFLNEHLGQTFLDRMMSLFGPALRRLHPKFEKRYARLDRLRAGLRRIDAFEEADVVLDAQICANTPVLGKATTVRGAHVDTPHKLFVGLYYLRDPADTSTGGDLQLYGPRPGSDLRWMGRFTAPERFHLCATVPYEHNVLVLFLNSIDSVHLVTARSPTTYPRLLVNLVGEVRDPLWQFQRWTYSRIQQRLLWEPATAMPWTAEDVRPSA